MEMYIILNINKFPMIFCKSQFIYCDNLYLSVSESGLGFLIYVLSGLFLLLFRK